MKKQTLKLFLLISIYTTIIVGCSALPEPVPVYKRGTLAKQNMALDVDPLEASLRQSSFANKAGASGGFSGTGGGCGCN